MIKEKAFQFMRNARSPFPRKQRFHINNPFTMIERDVSKSNSINLRFLLGVAMESTGKMPHDKNMQCL